MPDTRPGLESGVVAGSSSGQAATSTVGGGEVPPRAPRRSRRRHGRRRQRAEGEHSHNIAAMDSLTSGHAHIRTIHQPHTTPPRSPDSFIRRQSFSLETDETLDEESDFDPSGLYRHPHATLAGNLQGGTFAQRARAAELQAARARRELKEQDTNRPSSETITLKMRNKTKWTPLDLSTVTRSEGESSPAVAANSPLAVSIQTTSADQTSLVQPPINIPTTLSPFLPRPDLMDPCQAEYAMSVTGMESSFHSTPAQVDNQLALNIRPNADSPTPLGPKARGKENQQNLGAITQMPSLTPIPVLTGDPNSSSQWNPEMAQKLIKLQEQQIAELTSQLRREKREKFIMRQPSEQSLPSTSIQQYGATPLAPPGLPQRTPNFYESYGQAHAGQNHGALPSVPSGFSQMSQNQNINANYRQTHANQHYGTPPSLPPGLLQMNQHFTGPYGQTHLNQQYRDTMKGIYGKQYPAVKGTATALESAARTSVTDLGGTTQTTHKTSESDKNLFLKHLESIAAKDAKKKPAPKAETSKPESKVEEEEEEEEEELPPLLPGSEPLPWKERRVDIVFTRAPVPGAPYFGVPATADAYPDYSTQHMYSRYVPATFADDSPEKRTLSREEELNDWWTRDNRCAMRTKLMMNDFLEDNHHRRQAQRSGDLNALREANFTDERVFGVEPEYPWEQEKPADKDNGEFISKVLVPVLGNLKSYTTDKNKAFNPFGPPPSWAIDHSPSGNNSFFSQQWGMPPQRVGRDPRYRAVQHDGRSSVFEDPTGRWPREEYSYSRGRW